MKTSYYFLLILVAVGRVSASAGDLTVKLGTATEVRFVGAIRRFDTRGRALRPVDPRAALNAPVVDVTGTPVAGEAGSWRLRDVSPGRYDLIVLTAAGARIEGPSFPPVLEFDPFLPADTTEPDADDRAEIVAQIASARHYENKVTPLFPRGDAKQVRVFVQLVRDLPTSYDAEAGKPIATMRHEVWQFTKQTGAWVKERRTVVFDRVLLPRAELARTTWVWEPGLGDIVMTSASKVVTLELPARIEAGSAHGWVGRPTD